MADAISEQIAQVIVSRLESITVANGYPFSVSSVDRPAGKANEWTPRNLAVAVIQGEEEPNEQLTHAGNPPAVAVDLAFQLHCFVRPSDRDTESPSKTESAMLAACRKAIVAGAHDWYTFGGLAVIADFGRAEPWISPEGDHRGITLPLVVTYRYSEDDPGESRA